MQVALLITVEAERFEQLLWLAEQFSGHEVASTATVPSSVAISAILLHNHRDASTGERR